MLSALRVILQYLQPYRAQVWLLLAGLLIDLAWAVLFGMSFQYIVDEAIAVRPIDPDRVYFFGHSNGGFMSHRFACDRADLVAQRWRVDAATNQVDAAKAQFYPDINLVAFVGLSSLGLDRFVDAGSRTYGVGPALHLPLFDGGRLRAQLETRRADVDAAIVAYNGTLLRALREVADEVTSLQAIERQQQAQAEATAAADAAYELAVQRYQAGLGNFLVVLTAQTNVLAQRRAAADLKARHLAAEIGLARALGGALLEPVLE